MSSSIEPAGATAARPAPADASIGDLVKAPAKDASADEIEADIAATRERLAGSVDALADKVNVKARAQEKVDQTKDQAREKVGQAKAKGNELLGQAKRAPRPVQLAILGVPVLAIVLVIIRRLRRRS